MVKHFFKQATVALVVLSAGCAEQDQDKIALDIKKDSETVLAFQGTVYGLSHSDGAKLQAVADEMTDSFYWHSLPSPPMQPLPDGRQLAWTPRTAPATAPTPAYETESAARLKARIAEMHAGFQAYQAAYQEAHPDSSQELRCSTDQALCDRHVGENTQLEIRDLRNVYIAEVLAFEFGELGQVELTADEPEARISTTDKPFLMVIGDFQVESLSEENAERLFHGRDFMAGTNSHPCVFLVDVSAEDNARTLRSSNTAFCGFKLYSGVENVARYLEKQSR
ncbi:MAG: hypothetical protein ACK4VV_14160 [Pseudomonas sp.]